MRELEKMARVVGINHKGHGISDDLLFEPGVQRHNSEDELEELILPDSSPDISGRRRRRVKHFKDSDSTSSSSEDYGYVEEESLEDEEEDNNEELIASAPPQKLLEEDYEGTPQLCEPSGLNVIRLRTK